MSHTCLLYHLVFSTKERRPWLAPEIQSRLVPYIGGIIRDLGGQLLTANGPDNHLHVSAVLNQKHALMDVLQEIKGGSSKWMHQTFPLMRDFNWQDGYAAFTVSHSVMPRVVGYIQGQREHHAQKSFEQELIELLEKHGVKYDERYLVA